MNGFSTFTKKELVESWRTYRLPILLAVFLILGILSPLTAKMLPDIIGSIDMGGIEMTLPEPTALDSWTQFFSNVGQMGLLALAITFSGIMAAEISRGTLVNLLTKGLRRDTVILSKFAAATLIWTVAYLLCLAVTAAYTAYYWELDVQNALFAFSGLWLFGELIIALLILGGTLFSNSYGALGLAGGVLVALGIASIWPEAEKYNPLSLTSSALGLLNGDQAVADLAPALVICAVAVVAVLIAAIVAFRKKQL